MLRGPMIFASPVRPPQKNADFGMYSRKGCHSGAGMDAEVVYMMRSSMVSMDVITVWAGMLWYLNVPENRYYDGLHTDAVVIACARLWMLLRFGSATQMRRLASDAWFGCVVISVRRPQPHAPPTWRQGS